MTELEAQPDDQKSQWLVQKQTDALAQIGTLRGGRHVIFYASAFLQKPQAPAPVIQITHEDINGFMSVMYGMDWSKGLTLVLHSPGGVTNAAETIVAYLRSKFTDLEVIVPTFAMSAATMISLAAHRIVMGRQSQLGPIDPQFISGGRALSARAVVDQFNRAKQDIRRDLTAAHLWAPILQSIGPGLLQDSVNALAYGERMVAQWLESGMFAGQARKKQLARAAARHFNDARKHKSHGRRIDRDEARKQKLVVEDLESNQPLQEAVLSAYHLATIGIEKSPACKTMFSDTGRIWIKNGAS